MATINVNITVSATVAVLDAATIAAMIQWVETNIRQKLPATASVAITYTMVP